MENDIVNSTKNTLIDVARRLFAKTGIENTTMNDIALASQRGRRTLYTYFKSKDDIYHAVIESELNQVYESLEEVVDKEMPTDKNCWNLFIRGLKPLRHKK
ncbi:hypothetical protein AGMMS49525_18500 [Bacteroidia bacterium]|nr:hypothetical protein AGMMS49525_18500 [Bacteroidia bacterium]